MSSITKPPLPTGISISVKRIEIFCLNSKHTQKEIDKYNQEQDENNQKIWNDFRNKLAIWKTS